MLGRITWETASGPIVAEVRDDLTWDVDAPEMASYLELGRLTLQVPPYAGPQDGWPGTKMLLDLARLRPGGRVELPAHPPNDPAVAY